MLNFKSVNNPIYICEDTPTLKIKHELKGLLHRQGTGLVSSLLYTGSVAVIRKNERRAVVVVIKGGKKV